jgi:hypothetical protein
MGRSHLSSPLERELLDLPSGTSDFVEFAIIDITSPLDPSLRLVSSAGLVRHRKVSVIADRDHFFEVVVFASNARPIGPLGLRYRLRVNSRGGRIWFVAECAKGAELPNDCLHQGFLDDIAEPAS